MKIRLREQMKQKAAPIGTSDSIQRRLLAQDWWAAAFQAGIYRATPAEPSTDALLADLLARGAQIAVPMRRGAKYVWGWVDGSTRWQKRRPGILEPEKAAIAAPSDLRVILVPGLAFDAQGGRLGHGQGHFDRLLADTPALMVGLCCENRLVETVPMEPHDIRMDMVVTERRMIFTSTAEAKLEYLVG